MIRPAGESAAPWLVASLERTRREVDRQVRTVAALTAGPDGPHGGGKLLRPRLLLGVAAALGCRRSPAAVADVAAGIELVHLATLHHDDVLDGSHLRRQDVSPAARVGNRMSILFGDALLAAALELLIRHGDRGILAATARAVRAAVRGEIEQQMAHRVPGVRAWACLRVARLKTGSLFGLAGRVGARLGGVGTPAVTSASGAGRRLGAAFQLIDDVLDYVGPAEALGKRPGTDYRQGVATLPLAVAWRRATPAERRTLAAGFGSGGARCPDGRRDAGPAPSDDGFLAARALVFARGGVRGSLAVAGRMLARARRELYELGDPPFVTQYVGEIERRIPGGSPEQHLSALG